MRGRYQVNAFVFIVFVLMPAIGLLFTIRIWLLLRNGLRVTARIVGYKEERFDGGIDTDNSRSLPIASFRDERGREHRVTLLDPSGLTYAFARNAAPLDVGISRDGRFLYTLNAGTGTVAAFKVELDGHLTSLGEVDGLPVDGAAGLAVR